jgi:sugar/nucleoside kinase (ribokinase family)
LSVVIGIVGDLVEDIVAVVAWPPGAPDPASVLQTGSDTPATITRRPGGSAANVARTAVGLGIPARFIGQVGDDPTGALLVQELTAGGVDAMVRRCGTTGAVVVLLHPDGERSMITDRGVAGMLDRPEPGWLDGLDALHVPLYSMESPPLADTAVTLARWAHQRALLVTVDLSSTTLLRGLGPGVVDAIEALAPTVVMANDAEAEVVVTELGLDLGRLATRAAVVKRGPAPAILIEGSRRREIPAVDLGPVSDSTGAGDAFAAGLIGALAGGALLEEAVGAGHRAAARHLGSR